MGGLISSGTIEQVRAASDIVDIIGAHVPLKRNGANFVGLCPFHKEKSPSFNVSPQKQFFHCFGCKKGGNVFTFLQEYENIGFTDAVRRLAERAHIVIEVDNQPGMQEARRVAPAHARALMAAMTAAFARGQILGPLAVSLFASKPGGFALALVFAAALLALSCAMIVTQRKEPLR